MVTLSSTSASAKTSYGSTSSNNENNHHNNNHMKGTASVNSSTSDRIRLTTQSYPFAGAVLSPKHAQELTPSLCLAIASALAQQQQQNQQQLLQQQQQNQQISLPHLQGTSAGGGNSTSSRRATPSSASSVSSSSIGGSNNNNSTPTNSNNYVPTGPAMVPYTLWITEAWRVLGWAEPSAALFWEMATMYHTLLVANRAYTTEYYSNSNNTAAPAMTNHVTTNSNTHYIPPILSCGSASSVGSGTNNSNFSDRMFNNSTTTFFSPISNANMTQAKSKYSTVASAKELPVWLVGTYLLFHCEEYAHQRNLAGQMDDRRFMSASSTTTSSTSSESSSSSFRSSPPSPGGSSKMDFNALLKNSSLSPR
jgi:hypothetical protein